MNLLERINQFIDLILATLRQVSKGHIWLPLFGYFLLQWLVLYAHYNYLSPVFYGPISIWISLFGPERAMSFSHYPQHFLLLGHFSGWARLGLGLVLEGAVLGLVARLFQNRFIGSGVPEDSRSWLSMWLNLVIVWVVINGLMVAAGTVLPQLAAPIINGPRRLMAFTYAFMPMVYTLLFALFFMAIPAVIVDRKNGPAALWRSLSLFLRRPFTIFGLAFIILAVPILVGVLAGQPTGIVDSFKPELVYWLLVASLVAEMIAYFFWMGTAVRFLSEPESSQH